MSLEFHDALLAIDLSAGLAMYLTVLRASGYSSSAIFSDGLIC